MIVDGEGYRERTAEVEARVLFAALCYFCSRKRGNSVKLCTLRSWEFKLLSLLHCCVKSVVWQLGVCPLWKDSSSSWWVFLCTPPKENFILGSFLYFSLKKNKIEHIYFAEQILCRSWLPPVHEDDSVPAVQVHGVRTCQGCVRVVWLAGGWLPTRASALNTIALNLQQQTASSGSESQL